MSVVGSYVVVDVVISRLTIATGTAAIRTSVASVRQLRRTSLIDTSRISPSASGRSFGAAAGSALIRAAMYQPLRRSRPVGGRPAQAGGRAPSGAPPAAPSGPAGAPDPSPDTAPRPVLRRTCSTAIR